MQWCHSTYTYNDVLAQCSYLHQYHSTAYLQQGLSIAHLQSCHSSFANSCKSAMLLVQDLETSKPVTVFRARTCKQLLDVELLVTLPWCNCSEQWKVTMQGDIDVTPGFNCKLHVLVLTGLRQHHDLPCVYSPGAVLCLEQFRTLTLFQLEAVTGCNGKANGPLHCHTVLCHCCKALQGHSFNCRHMLGKTGQLSCTSLVQEPLQMGLLCWHGPAQLCCTPKECSYNTTSRKRSSTQAHHQNVYGSQHIALPAKHGCRWSLATSPY